MAIPGFQEFMLPLLQFAAEQSQPISTKQAAKALAQLFQLTEEEITMILPSGNQTVFTNRVGWAASHLKKAGLLKTIQHGYYSITPQGHALLDTKPPSINNKTLLQYPGFAEFKSNKKNANESVALSETDVLQSSTPAEALENAHVALRNALADELLTRLKQVSPAFFEQVVIDLLVKMGYGGSRADAGKVIGKSGDGGIDGIIKEDRLGLDVIYVQAKRWDNTTVGSPDVMKFAGALQAQKASKGIFITTSSFTQEARNYVSQIGSKIVLIDGEQLTHLMIDHDVGVSIVSLYPVKKIDSDYFDDN